MAKGRGRKDGWMDGWKDGRKDGNLEIPPCPTGHRPFGAAAQKGLEMLKYANKLSKDRTWSVVPNAQLGVIG